MLRISDKELRSMWFEQFYSGVITIAFVAGTLYMSYPFNIWDVGRRYRRDYCTPQRPLVFHPGRRGILAWTPFAERSSSSEGDGRSQRHNAAMASHVTVIARRIACSIQYPTRVFCRANVLGDVVVEQRPDKMKRGSIPPGPRFGHHQFSLVSLDSLPECFRHQIEATGSIFLPRDISQDNIDDEVEGFLCPICMSTFTAPELLSEHFEEAHNKEGAIVSSPNFDYFTPPSSGGKFYQLCLLPGVLDIKKLKKLRTQINEERIYSAKLKEEVDRIQSIVAQATDVPHGDVPYLMQQIQVLEAGKSMATQRMLEFEKENVQLRRMSENGQQERSEIMVKLKQLSGQIRELTDENEGHKVEKEMLSRKLMQCNEDNDKLRKELDVLNKTLDQRPSEDDVAVLRTELVHAQKLMDEISQQKDVEISEQINSIRQLSMEREKQRCVMENLQKELLDTSSSSKESSDKLCSVLSELDDTRQLLLTCQKDLQDARDDAAQKSEREEELRAKVEANVTELIACREKIAQLEETIRISTREIDDSHAMNESNLKKLTQLSDKLGQVIEEKKRYETEMIKFEERNEMLSNNIRTDLSSKRERKLTEEKNSLIDSKDQELFATREELERSRVEVKRLTESCTSMALEIESTSNQLVTLQENTKELVDQVSIRCVSICGRQISQPTDQLLIVPFEVSQGNDGTKAAIDQLNEEKRKLVEENCQLTNCLKEEIIDLENQILGEDSELEKSHRDEIRNVAEEMKRSEVQKEALERRLREAEDDVNRKTERFVEMEKEIDEERRLSHDRVNKLKEVIRSKETSFLETRKQLEEISSQLAEKNRHLREKERQIEENRQKIEEAISRLADAELKARKLEAELSQCELQRVFVSDSVSKLRSQLEENQGVLSSSKQEVEELTAKLNAKEQALRDTVIESNEKEEQWKRRQAEFEQQLEESHRQNEELRCAVKDLHTSLDTEKDGNASRQAKIDELTAALNESSSRITELVMELEESRKSVEAFELSLEDVKVQLAEEKCRFETTQKKYEESALLLQSVENALCDARVELDAVKKNADTLQAELESRIESVESEKASLLDDVKTKQEEIHRLSKLNSLIQEDLASRTAQLDEFHERVAKLENEIADGHRKLEALEVGRQEAIDECISLRAKNEETSKMTEELQTQSNKEIEELRRIILSKEEDLTNTERRCAQFEKLSRDVQLSMDRQLSAKSEEIERLNCSIAEIESLSSAKEEKLSGEISALKRAIAAVQSELDEQVRVAKEAEKTAEELTSANMELAKKAASWEEEKNALIERCLNTESDLDFERDRALENKRRFDEALSAMHELGRANQSLQMDISKHTSRSWLDDSAAVNCTTCGKLFSLTVRKHHCRVCGLIFCNLCSSKTAQVASHKNPVRVCDNCFTEVQNR
ncbi:FYVE zinc finger [Parelaphostrongylus tenuis]|uniref:FYVE zinc finger n=1 Tax=Parelaphostrongylus tenuis TaxID=148309 RepID=A0AAD5R992_PARTN|nr:FYVE zinc finger [Parelaphostrongylus tenuis]